jgi:hypothetical protein
MLVFIDGADLQDIQPDVRSFLIQAGLHTKDKFGATAKASYCGFIPLQDGFAVFLPKTFRSDYPDEENKELARLLFRSLKKYFYLSRLDKQQVTLGDVTQMEADLNALSQMAALSDILTDWIGYGPYKNKEFSFKTSLSGKIDWKRSERRVTPFISSNGAQVFPHFVTRRRDYLADDLVADLQRWAVAQADAYLGWLFSEGDRDIMFPELARFKDKMPCGMAKAIAVLRKALRVNFDQRKIRLIKLLLRLLQSQKDGRGGNLRMGVKSFWPVWERICKEICEDELDSHFSSLPQPEYISSKTLPNGYGWGISQKPDIMTLQEKSMVVVDAKYYDMSETQPGWSDIVKQLYYADAVIDSGQWGTVRNVFAFPKPQSEQIAERVIIKKEVGESRYNPIYCVYIDAVHALKAFAGDEIQSEELRNKIKVG